MGPAHRVLAFRHVESYPSHADREIRDLKKQLLSQTLTYIKPNPKIVLQGFNPQARVLTLDPRETEALRDSKLSSAS